MTLTKVKTSASERPICILLLRSLLLSILCVLGGIALAQNAAQAAPLCRPNQWPAPDGKCHTLDDYPLAYDPPITQEAQSCWQDSDCPTGSICERAGRPSEQPGVCAGGVVHSEPRTYPLTPHPKSQ